MFNKKPQLENFETYMLVLYGFELLRAKGHRGAIVSFGGHEDKVRSVAETGYAMKGEMAACGGHSILEIFSDDNTHDLGVVVLNNTILAAHCQFPMPKFDPKWDESVKKLGSRHRAAMGMSQETGAEVLVLSDETGYIRVARDGKLFSVGNVFEAIKRDKNEDVQNHNPDDRRDDREDI